MCSIILMLLASGDPNEWSTFPSGKTAGSTAQPAQAAPASPSSVTFVPEAAKPRYRDAVAAVSGSRFQEATVLLNQLTAEYPQVAELYAAQATRVIEAAGGRVVLGAEVATVTARDRAVGVLGKDSSGNLAMTQVTLRPEVNFGGEKVPGPEELRQLHDRAHHACFIANSVKTEVVVEPQLG